MLSILYPDCYTNSIFEIDFRELKNMGIRILLFDIDNTLEPFDVRSPSAKVVSLIGKVKEMGFKIILVSNNYPKRVGAFNRNLELPVIFCARKPMPFKILKAVHRQGESLANAAIIGDQIFTDVLCGNIMGIVSILVKPISERDELTVKLKRHLERLVIKKYKASLKKSLKDSFKDKREERF